MIIAVHVDFDWFFLSFLNLLLSIKALVSFMSYYVLDKGFVDFLKSKVRVLFETLMAARFLLHRKSKWYALEF